jgi:hypothetical protein
MVSRRVTSRHGKKDRTCFATLQSAMERDDSLLRAKILANRKTQGYVRHVLYTPGNRPLFYHIW